MNENTDQIVDEEIEEQIPSPLEEQEEEVVDSISDEDILSALDNPSEAVKAKLDALIAAAVKKALAGAVPKRKAIKTDPLTKEQFAKMSYQERCRLFESNRPLYEKLKGAM